MGMSLECGQRREVKTINRRTLRCISVRIIPASRNNVNVSPLSGTERYLTDSLHNRPALRFFFTGCLLNFTMDGGRTVVPPPQAVINGL
jgi:hypothetical protein